MTNQVAPNPSMLGARIRPPDPKEIKYRLSVPPTVDMTKAASVGPWMPHTGESQVFGSCTGQAVKRAMECLFNVTGGRMAVPVDPYVVYYLARVVRDFFGEGHGADTGAYLADAFDVAMPGVPRDDLWPTPATAAEAPSDAVLADAPNQNWLLGHQPMYASDPGGFVAGLWQSFANRQPVGIAMAWYNRWFDHHEILSDIRGDHAGFHAICAYAGIPAGWLHPEPLIVIRNSWGGYTDVSQLKTVLPEAEPGDVAIPERYFLDGVVNEARAATAEVIVTPKPDPTHGYTQGYTDARTQDIQFLRWLESFYRDQGTDFGEIAELVCRYEIEIMEGFGPPQAQPRLPKPPTMKGDH